MCMDMLYKLRESIRIISYNYNEVLKGCAFCV